MFKVKRNFQGKRLVDFSNPNLGHYIGIDKVRKGGHILDVHGFGPMLEESLQKGDLVLLKNSKAGNGDGRTQYMIHRIEYEHDPADMFWATLKFYPRVYDPINPAPAERKEHE